MEMLIGRGVPGEHGRQWISLPARP
jgi:hypothetical protein